MTRLRQGFGVAGETRMTKERLDQRRGTSGRRFRTRIHSNRGAVMLSGAKHLRFLSPGDGPNEKDQRFFAKPVLSEAEGLRMTMIPKVSLSALTLPRIRRLSSPPRARAGPNLFLRDQEYR